MSRTTVVAAVAGLVLLAGCDSSTEPSAPPTSQDALTTPTEEPSEDTAATSEPAETSEEATTEEPDADGAPEMPDEATEQTEAGAEAFAEHYISTLNWAYMTGETEAAQELSDPECQSCAGLIAEAEEYQTEGDYVETEQTAATLSSDGARVEVTINQLTGPGAGEADIVVRLTPSQDAWIVDEITIVE
ncbi:DUF6318 family protein [Serinicoccus hydrothermalis]|uniref:DUF6318 family protein n=1 Tax=Serinicoccus hydrothermalis TaxID=1758689 RepID=UPI000836B29D|nr:DUF6318 family protein [Serinicoccus hydrothermalis]